MGNTLVKLNGGANRSNILYSNYLLLTLKAIGRKYNFDAYVSEHNRKEVLDKRDSIGP